MFVAEASSGTADSQGRVVIPPGPARVRRPLQGRGPAGQIRRVEIWDKAEWERYRAVAGAAADETNAAHLAELGI